MREIVHPPGASIVRAGGYFGYGVPYVKFHLGKIGKEFRVFEKQRLFKGWFE